ncbi:hypothetical protein D3C81_1397190 [compost metagenome]
MITTTTEVGWVLHGVRITFWLLQVSLDLIEGRHGLLDLLPMRFEDLRVSILHANQHLGHERTDVATLSDDRVDHRRQTTAFAVVDDIVEWHREVVLAERLNQQHRFDLCFDILETFGFGHVHTQQLGDLLDIA